MFLLRKQTNTKILCEPDSKDNLFPGYLVQFLPKCQGVSHEEQSSAIQFCINSKVLCCNNIFLWGLRTDKDTANLCIFYRLI